MRSLAVYTAEMDDLKAGIKELRAKLNNFELGKNSMGIVFAHADTDFQELANALQDEFGFPILGSSAMSMFTESDGYVTEGISLHVFTADDCTFVAGVTDEMDQDSYKAKIKSTYSRLEEELGEKPKVIITYAVKDAAVAGDEYVDILNDASGGVPIFGGFSSDNFLFSDCRIMVNREVRAAGMGMILVGGNTKPVLKCRFSVETTDFEEVVTEVEGNTVYKLGNRTLVDVVREAGVDLDSENLLSKFVGSPFLVTYKKPNGDEIELMRHLASINKEEGSGTFIGSVPKGAVVRLAMFSRKDVTKSVAEAIRSAVVDVSNEHEYIYTSAIITSCASRLMTFSSDTIVDEAKGYANIIPQNIRFSGMYSFGEFCPVVAEQSKNSHNCFHNTTFTFIVL